jgi:hypothetical protein
MDALVGTLAGIVAGGLITWLASRHYYLRAGADLSREAAELRRLTELILGALEVAGLVELDRDPSGVPIGMRIRSAGGGVSYESLTRVSASSPVSTEGLAGVRSSTGPARGPQG